VPEGSRILLASTQKAHVGVLGAAVVEGVEQESLVKLRGLGERQRRNETRLRPPVLGRLGDDQNRHQSFRAPARIQAAIVARSSAVSRPRNDGSGGWTRRYDSSGRPGRTRSSAGFVAADTRTRSP
jgi:hypothetical protein